MELCSGEEQEMIQREDWRGEEGRTMTKREMDKHDCNWKKRTIHR